MDNASRIPPRTRQARFARKLASAAIGALILGTTGAYAHAEGITSSPYLLGDWGGWRTRLANDGVSFNLGYTGELAHNFTGGDKRITRYSDQWALGTTFDLDKLVGWKGATFQTTFTERNGRNLGADANIGNNMLLQEVYGRGQTVHLTDFWLDQKLFDNKLSVKLGRMTVGEDFASFSCDFQNLTFCGSQPGNLVGSYWVNWPTSQWAARVKLTTSKETYAQVGVYQVNPNYVNDDYARTYGWTLQNPSGTTGALIPLEGGWTPKVNGLPGSYKVGVWYNTSSGKDLYYDINNNSRAQTGLAALNHGGQYGAYINFQQQITGEPGGRGASLFLNISQADRATAQTDRQIAMGVQYKGPFGRPNDSIGFGIGATHNNGRYADYVNQLNALTGSHTVAGDGNEYATEVYYSWSPIPSVFMRLNLQYVVHPGGTSLNHNAFVVGLKTGITF
ncbi:carbohydrate porin [Bordetella sp. FB-8]|uniref:carbohydrate porin n=1 Tax=Bordetella sp. FB-8 TaxID=1159870 RepID=UPI0003740EAB|nr:carbohydrate porin [Bordetella sp. FB-8]